MFPVKGRNKTYMPQKETYVLGPQFTIQPSPVTERASRQPDPLTQKNTDLLNASNARCSTSSSLDGPITANLQVDHQHRNNLAHGSQRAAGVSGKRQVLPSTAFVHELSSKHGNNPDHSSSGSIHGSDQDQQSSRSAQSGHRTQYNSSVYLPGDRVIFTENASTPGIPVVYRTPEERAANPDRLNLDRRRLAVCPILEGEDQLRLLNYQHNFITRIQNLNSLKRLIFLDLYDNQITEISGLSSLKALRVLMLGKNRIKKINNLEALTKLDVLDLHGNEICHIDHLNHLAELRVLNLAGNRIEFVDNLSGMSALTELNLRRNNIRSVAEVDQLPNLQRLFLSFNEITCFEDIQCLADSPSLAEISLDGNPFAQEPHYKQIVLRYMNHLRQFDMKPVSVDERRIATVMAKKEEEKKRESYKTAVMKERRRVAISNARRHWELMQGSAMSQLNRMNKQPPELYANHISNVPSSDASQDDDKTEENGSSRSSSSQLNSRPTSAKSLISEKEWPAGGSTKQHSRLTSRASSVSASSDKDKFSVMGDSETSYNTDFLSEIEGDTLNLYGDGALEAFDRSWGVQAAGAVTTICFKFIDFDHITKILHKIRVRFPNVNTLIFNSTNISSLAQLNALSSIRRLDNLVIEKDGNPITEFVLWRTYLLFRLAHFCLKKINDVEVSASDIVNAERFFGTLAHMTTSQLPQARLLALLGDKKKQLLSDEKNKKMETKLVDRTTESVGRAGLVYLSTDVLQQKQQDLSHRQKFVQHYVKQLTYDAIQSNHKLTMLHTVWPQILSDLVHTAVIDMWDTNSYMKKCLEDVEKN